jgi:hypothetical protein
MSWYQWVWRALWGTVAAIAIAAAFIIWPLSVVLGLLFIPAFVAAFATFVYYREPNRPKATRSVALRRSLAVGTRAGTCTVALMSLASALPTLVWPLLALCVCTSPFVLRRVGDAVRSTRESRRRRERAPVEEAAWWGMLAREVEGLADGELCRAWRDSYSALLEAADAATAAQIVRVRQAYLDELDRRHQRAMSAWLASGPRPATGPERFLQMRRERDSA